MRIFNYLPETGEYIGEALADESPRERGAFLIPANATTEAPPDIPRGAVATWTGTGWEVSEPAPAEPTPPRTPTVKEAVGAPIEYGGETWVADDEAIRNITAVLLANVAGVALPSKIQWRTADSKTVDVDIEFLKGLSGAILERAMVAYQESWRREDANSQKAERP